MFNNTARFIPYTNIRLCLLQTTLHIPATKIFVVAVVYTGTGSAYKIFSVHSESTANTGTRNTVAVTPLPQTG